MDIVSEVRGRLSDEWLPIIYRDRIRAQRTRAFHLDIRATRQSAEILYTLLGIELKVGRRRFGCPDLATARYLRVFARIGCCDFAVPYDITKIAPAADELEISWQKALLIVEDLTKSEPRAVKQRRLAAVARDVRRELVEIGAGDLMPEFTRK